ncbi:MAG: efflux pump, RND family, membrane fusion lipoprotein [Deltaproteobacteria bacterium CSP1-8]|nr:MAG: efflux pump, RND family, membrane fusion lipoprotein [Deltaproteobacteria bacterium CSP1-8]
MTGKRRRTERIGRPAGKFAARGIGIFLLAGIVAGMAGCGEKGKHGPATAERPLVTGVELVTAGSAPRERFGEAVGTIRANNIAAVAPQVMGRVTSLPVAEGVRVGKGALLATIDDTQVRAQLAAAEAMVAEAEGGREEAERSIAQAEAGRSLAEKTYERFRKLNEEKVITPQEFDEVEVKRTVAVKEYERSLDKRAQAVAKIAQAKAQADAARAMLSYTRVTAPFPGVVTEKRADAGSMAVPGVPIVVLEDTGRYRLEASVPETYLGTLKVGSRVRVVLGTPPGKEIPGTVSEVVPQVDPESRTFTAKVDLPAGGALRTGMFGRVLFPTGKEDVLVVPQRAISRVGGYDALYTVTADNVARLVMVTTGKSFGDEVEILSGIEPGARVAISPLEKLVDGARVEVRK